MKKIYEKIKPFFSVILGALLLLSYLFYVQRDGSALALGIVSIVVAAFYIGYGVVAIILGDKLPALLKKILDVVVFCLFPAFMFTEFLIITINLYDNYTPAGWIIAILGMVAALGIAAIYAVASFVKVKILGRLVQLFALIFVLALLMNVLFDATGLPEILGNIALVYLIIYSTYACILFSAIGTLGGGEKVEEPEE